VLSPRQYERIRQLVQPVSAIGAWLLPKALVLAAAGLLALTWLVFYLLQFWAWHYLWLLPLTLLSLPVLIIALWTLMLADLKALPEALADLYSVVSDQKPHDKSGQAVKETVERPKVRQLPSLLKELWTLVQGVDALRTVVSHVIMLVNPVSWLVLGLSAALIGVYVFAALMSLLFYLT
jgi:hypothetical protein